MEPVVLIPIFVEDSIAIPFVLKYRSMNAPIPSDSFNFRIDSSWRQNRMKNGFVLFQPIFWRVGIPNLLFSVWEAVVSSRTGLIP